MLITTTETIPDKQYEIISEVFGLTTISRNRLQDLGVGLKSVIGREIKAYTNM